MNFDRNKAPSKRIGLPDRKLSLYIWIDALLITLLLGGLFFLLVDARPLFVPDEGRYAEIAREMVNRGDYITPYLNGIKYFEKPVLFYWLESMAIHWGGLHLWSLRTVNALLGLIGCLLTYFVAQHCYGRTAGWVAAGVLGTSSLYFVMTNMISLDLPVTVFLTASLYAFILAAYCPRPLPRRLYMWAAAIAAALAVLTKGLIGLLFPALIIGAWILINNHWRLLKTLYLPSSFILFLLIAVPWHILVSINNPEFPYFYFVEQHFLRYATPGIGHDQPTWFFIPCLMLGLFPWIVFLPTAIFSHLAQLRQKVPVSIASPASPQLMQGKSLFAGRGFTVFLMLWSSIVFIFFSFSKSKLIPYILPIFPPLAILIAACLASPHFAKKTLRLCCFLLFILAIFLGCFLHLWLSKATLPSPYLAKIYIYSACLLLVTGYGIAWLNPRLNKSKVILLLTTTTGLFLFIISKSISTIDTRSIQSIALLIKPKLALSDEVVAYHQYYQDLPFYLERRISIVNWRNELSFGIQHQDTRDWMIDDQTFWKRWQSAHRVYAFLNQEEYQRLLPLFPQKPSVIGKTLNTILISNH